MSHFGFIEQFEKYFNYHSDTPTKYGTFLGLKLLGHVMGYKSINLIQPGEVHHRMGLLLEGDSTWVRKSTAQKLAKKTFPIARQLAEETSPEQAFVDMAENPEQAQFLGEFTKLLRGINSGGNMAGFVEFYNDMFDCPEILRKKLRHKKGVQTEWTIKNGYLSLSSTTTPRMLEKYLTEELMVGGFLPRWLIVHGDARYRPRGRLREDALRLRQSLKDILERIVNMEDEEVHFELDDEALAYFNKLEDSMRGKYDDISAFVGRYLEYVISIADILLVSDAIGKALENGTFEGITRLTQLLQLTQLKQLTRNEGVSKGKKPLGVYNGVSRVSSLVVSREYVERAWKLIEPLFKRIRELTVYVEVDKPRAKVMRYLKKVGEAGHTQTLQHTHITADQMEKVIKTLQQSDLIGVKNVDVERKGAGLITKNVYRWKGEK